MRPPRTFHIREFINRSENISGQGLLFQKENILNIAKELADILAYTLELENQIQDLEQKIEQNEVISVEIISENF